VRAAKTIEPAPRSTSRTTTVNGKCLSATHYLVEEIPELVAKELREFLLDD
jgi:hypothetical protein